MFSLNIKILIVANKNHFNLKNYFCSLELIPMLTTSAVFPFREDVCTKCHKVPKFNEWIQANITGTFLTEISNKIEAYFKYDYFFTSFTFQTTYKFFILPNELAFSLTGSRSTLEPTANLILMRGLLGREDQIKCNR